jgi:two-component system, OmpR family, phosphate regulon sensor histidine kinase PhoR
MAQRARVYSSFILLLAFILPAGLAAVWFWQHPQIDIASILFLTTLAAITVLVAVVARLNQKSSGELQRLNEIAQELSDRASSGIEGRVLPAAGAEPIEALRRSIEELQLRIAYLEAERDGLKAILAAMEEGVIVVDSRKRILVANSAARKILRLQDTDPVGAPLIEMTSQPDLLGNIELSIVASQACSFEFYLPVPGETGKCFIMAHCAPFHDETRRLSGAVAVLHDITDLRRLERMRTEFVSNVSHELRTPLTSLLGYLETLESGAWEDKQQADQFLKICRRQAENLSRIVEDLLRLSRLENPQQEIANTEIDLAEVAAASVEQCEPLAHTRKIALKADLPEGSVPIRGDRGLLVQAVSNLVENAINYNHENGRVQVRLSRVGRDGAEGDGAWEIAVSDTGIGIPQAALKHVFERFYRVDKARSRDRGGTGLGLAIVKHIALAHGASVHVESEVGKGTTFYMRFKAQRATPQTVASV